MATGTLSPSNTTDAPAHGSPVDDRRNRTCVIGAGTSGLVMVRRLREQGLPVDCLERQSDLGGNWNIALPYSRVYESTHLISSKALTEYLDYPMPDEWPEFPSHRLVLEYLRGYADHFKLEDHVEYDTAVRRVEPVSNDDGAGGWFVELASGERRRYGRLVIANGHNWDPSFPAWSGRRSETPFAGIELHSGEYKQPTVFQGRRVLVVGGGNSGCDIAAEAAQNATLTRLSLRRGYHFLPKFFHGTPIDVCGERLLRLGVPLPVRRLLANGMIFLTLGTRAGTGLPRPDHRLFESHPTINSQLVYRLRHGELEVRPDVERLTEGGVRYVDGREEAFDVIVYATGYRLSFSFIDEAELNWRDGRPELYANVFHPTRDDLFVLGMIQPDSGSWGLVDRQARLIAQYLIALEHGTPAGRAFQQKKQRPAAGSSIRYVDSPRHLVEVEHHGYRKLVDREWRKLRRGAPRPAVIA